MEQDQAAIILDGSNDQQRNVLADIVIERGRQQCKWGEQNHEPSIWLAILSEEVGELATAILALKDHQDGWGISRHRRVSEMRQEAIQVAAVAVQFIEWLDLQADGIGR